MCKFTTLCAKLHIIIDEYTEKCYYVFMEHKIADEMKVEELKKERDSLLQLNKALQSVYENYNNDTICITDNKGTIEYCGEACERHCGLTADELIGKNVSWHEKEKHFYPSVTLRVLKSKRTEVIMQDTQIGVSLITIGVPIFDEFGEIKKVISISRDFSKELEIATLLAETQTDIADNESYDAADETIITCCDKIYSIMTLMRMVAPSNSTFLLTGESGTGKGVFAKYIHRKSKRSEKPFISVSCGAIAENLIESELFGYEPSTFTGADKQGREGLIEAANGGTLFLDEIGELPLSQQVKLLHVLQDKQLRRVGGRKCTDVDVRIIAATNRNLEEMVKEGTFREDLFYRLNVVTIHVPSLRERKEDIPLLIKHFLKERNKQNGTDREISNGAIQRMTEYYWPGNVRELENTIEMLSLTTTEHTIEESHLPAKMRSKKADVASIDIKQVMPLKDAVAAVEKKMIELALLENGGSQLHAAKQLGVDRTTITRKVNQYKIK